MAFRKITQKDIDEAYNLIVMKNISVKKAHESICPNAGLRTFEGKLNQEHPDLGMIREKRHNGMLPGFAFRKLLDMHCEEEHKCFDIEFDYFVRHYSPSSKRNPFSLFDAHDPEVDIQPATNIWSVVLDDKELFAYPGYQLGAVAYIKTKNKHNYSALRVKLNVSWLKEQTRNADSYVTYDI